MNRNEDFIKFREQFPIFEYNDFAYHINKDNLTFHFTFICGDNVFTPKYTIPFKTNVYSKNLTEAQLKLLIFYIGMAEMMSYWKFACSPLIKIKPYGLSNEQIAFWKKLFFKGMGEFRYLNGIETTENDFVSFESEGELPAEPVEFQTREGYLVPIGGGKDSVVTLELLRKDNQQVIPFVLNPRKASLDCIRVAGYRHNEFFETQRTLDPKLLSLNDKGYLNGHTPFSALLAFICILAAAISKKRYVALSNEISANESTVAGEEINHQYSKSLEFEDDFRKYVSDFITKDIEYFSFLRISELRIASLFTSFDYKSVFRSCNVGSKQDIWCGHCSKCLFAFIILSPYIAKDELVNIFGKNLFCISDDNLQLKDYFLELTGVKSQKPFECVGTIAEVNAAIALHIEKYGIADNDDLLRLWLENVSKGLTHKPDAKEIDRIFYESNLKNLPSAARVIFEPDNSKEGLDEQPVKEEEIIEAVKEDKEPAQEEAESKQDVFLSTLEEIEKKRITKVKKLETKKIREEKKIEYILGKIKARANKKFRGEALENMQYNQPFLAQFIKEKNEEKQLLNEIKKLTVNNNKEAVSMEEQLKLKEKKLQDFNSFIIETFGKSDKSISESEYQKVISLSIYPQTRKTCIISRFKNETIGIFGFGREGKSTYNFFRMLFPHKELIVADEKPIFDENFRAEDWQNVNFFDGENIYNEVSPLCSVIFKSPGIPSSKFPQKEQKKITSQTDMFLRHFSKQTIGITGTKGKSTTSSLIYACLQDCDVKSVLIGNIGVPPLDHFWDMDEKTLAVAELSAHQLEKITVAPRFAVYLNIFEEHLDYYGTLKKYILAKQQIFLKQKKGDYLVFPINNTHLKKFVMSSPKQNLIPVLFENYCIAFGRYIVKTEQYMPLSAKSLPGEHNKVNMAVTYEVCRLFGLPDSKIIHTCLQFKSLPHRIELVGTVKKSQYFNDSISTTPQSTIAALDALKKVETLILGGMDRGINYNILAKKLPEFEVKNVALMGNAGKRIGKILRTSGFRANYLHSDDLAEIVHWAKEVTHVNKMVLLSPAAPSYDQFRNFEHRGEIFRQCVREEFENEQN
ncbi:MAG: UDP-N-acetylmuramoyl-L-alanine--D-glutamate ligase [Bacteroidales bacterium]|jgi:UDP-N-acetylmuramoylalanine--D-glutamate ligase|nr:UDP-N-acetylmuramoyl-L-alanine--D-glutamate ligase [Bacteroidales bacterium]